MPRRTIDLQFPRLGVVRRFGVRQTGRQADFGTPYSYNARLEDSLTNRLRGGSFTGTAASARPSEILYRDRVLSFSGQAITATRMGDHTDTTMSADVSDVMRPSLFQLSLAGEQGDDVVALVPHKDHYLLGFTATEMWIQQGDPLTGPRRRVSDQVGIIGPDAWCVAHDTVYFMSALGLYSVGADGSGLKALSEDYLPEHLVGVSDVACALDYDHATRGVSIHLTAAPSWFYDTERGGFWPFDTTETDSHLLIGPVKLGSSDELGLLQAMHGIMAAGSDTVNWAIVPGATAEEAASNAKTAVETALAAGDYSSYIRGSGSWDAGRSQTARPRTTAMWVVLWLSSEGDWAYEGLTFVVEPAGWWRA